MILSIGISSYLFRYPTLSITREEFTAKQKRTQQRLTSRNQNNIQEIVKKYHKYVKIESTRFCAQPLRVMHVDVLKSACDALGWQYTIQDNILTVSDAKQKSRLYGEFALKLNLTTNEVTYNTHVYA